MPRILVLGATGFVGSRLCHRLAQAGLRVTAATRRAEHARRLLVLPLLEVVETDLHDPLALRRLVAGHDAVVNLVAILHGRALDFERVHVALPANLAQACLALGVPRLIHVSALGAAADGPSLYQRSKAAGEATLLDAAGRGLRLTLLRPSVMFGADDRFLNLFARLQRWLPFIPLAAARTRFQPVWVEDVVQALSRCLMDPATAGVVYEACGPQVMSLREIVELAGRLSRRGGSRPILELPSGPARLQAKLMEWAPGPPLMSQDNLDSMRVDNVAGGELPGLEALGIEPRSLASVAATCLGPQASELDDWRKGAGR